MFANDGLLVLWAMLVRVVYKFTFLLFFVSDENSRRTSIHISIFIYIVHSQA